MYRTYHKHHKRALAIVATAVAALLLAGCSTAGGSAKPSNAHTAAGKATAFPVALGFSKNYEYAGSWVADDSGLYAAAGLAPNFLAGGPNAPAPEVSIASGQAVMGIESNTSRLFSYLAKANDIVIIGAAMQKTPNGLLSLAAHPVTKPSQLEGAKVIAAAQNQTSIDTLMTINDVQKYTFVPGGADVGPLLNGQGTALLAFATNQPITLEQQGMKEGKDFFFTPFDKFGYNLMSDVMIVSRSYLEKHRDKVVAFMKATIEGWNSVIKDPKKGAQLAVDKYGADLGLNLTQQTAALKAQIPYMTSKLTKTKGLFALDPSEISAKVYPSLEKGGISNLPDVNKVVDTTVLRDAEKQLKK